MRLSLLSKLKLIWFILCVFVFIMFPVVHTLFDDKYYVGYSLFWLDWGMWLLSFPSGMLLSFLICQNTIPWQEFSLRLIPCGGEYNMLHSFYFWLGNVVIGYWQWFWLIPRFLRKEKTVTLSNER